MDSEEKSQNADVLKMPISSKEKPKMILGRQYQLDKRN